MQLEGHKIDRYHLLHRIGSGGMGEVYFAEDERIAQKVAIKLIHTGNAKEAPGEKEKRLFQREATAIARLDHPNILPLYDYGETTIDDITLSYLVMPFRQEGTLADWLQRRPKHTNLSPQDVANFIKQASEALQHAHDHHVIHQDVKPSNFLIRSRPDQPDCPELQLSDFGIAKFYATSSSMSQEVRGTPAYMAPEQWDGYPIPSSDQYALAIMAYELLTGQLPFNGRMEELMLQHFESQPQPPSTLNPCVPAEVDIVLAYALAKKPEDRFASMTAFAHAFELATTPESLPQALSVSSKPEGIATTQPLVAKEAAAPPLTYQTTPVPDTAPKQSRDSRGSFIKQISVLTGTWLTQTQLALPSISRWLEPTRNKAILLGMVLLIILASSGIWYTVSANAAYRSSSAATATARAVTARAITATAIARERNPYSPGNGTLLLDDPLQNNAKGYGWDEVVKPARSCQFANGAYLVQALKGLVLAACTAQNMNFANFALEMDMTFLADGYGGIIFRADIPNSRFYYFQIGSAGVYYLYLYVDTHTENNKTLIDTTSMPASVFHAGPNQTNVLGIVANGDAIDLYVNHHHLQTIHDNTISHGQISATAASLTGPLKVVYSHARLWKL
ncbi:MAG TPA: serine/threonine-protein kinase [Ktedonosporobacter sp.]|nr:serine/threonine-protein kinase [Ktedonosporobacter sp.]